MTYSIVGPGGDRTGPRGYTYAAVVVRVAAASRAADPGRPDGSPHPVPTRDGVLTALRQARFSGWVGAVDNGWVAVVPRSGAGTVASGRRGVVGLGGDLAAGLGATVVAVRVLADRQLLVAVWDGGRELGRYVSDPSVGHPDDDLLPDPLGVEHAEAFAGACGRADDADDLVELLAEELDHDSVIESERLAGVLRLLGLPGWLVAVSALPRDVPAGPRASELTRLGAGAEGLPGALRGWAVEQVRRRRTPPDPVPDGPRGPSDADLWMLG